MWEIISKVLINIVIKVISDKVVVDAGVKLISKGVDSILDGVGVTDQHASDLLNSIATSNLNRLTHEDLGF